MVAPLALLGLSAAADVVGGLLGGKGKAATAGVGAAGAATGAGANKAKLKKTAQDFESVFLEQAFDRLTANAGDSGPLGGGDSGGSVYRSMLVKEYAGQVVKSGGVGVSDSVYRQMLQMQEGAARG